MKKFSVSNLKRLLTLRNDVRGVTALEYGLIAAVVGTVIAVGFTTYGNSLKTALSNLTV